MFCSFTVCSVLSLGVPPCNCLFVWLGLWPYTDALFLICALCVLSPVWLCTPVYLFRSPFPFHSESSSIRPSSCLSDSTISLFSVLKSLPLSPSVYALLPACFLCLSFTSYSLFLYFSVSLSFRLFLTTCIFLYRSLRLYSISCCFSRSLSLFHQASSSVYMLPSVSPISPSISFSLSSSVYSILCACCLCLIFLHNVSFCLS